MSVVPFATPTSYEIVDCSLEASRLIFLNCIPRPDVGGFPRVGSLGLSDKHSPQEDPW